MFINAFRSLFSLAPFFGAFLGRFSFSERSSLQPCRTVWGGAPTVVYYWDQSCDSRRYFFGYSERLEFQFSVALASCPLRWPGKSFGAYLFWLYHGLCELPAISNFQCCRCVADDRSDRNFVGWVHEKKLRKVFNFELG